MESLESTLIRIENKNNRNRDKLNKLDGRLTVIRGKGTQRRESRFSNSFDAGFRKRDKS